MDVDIIKNMKSGSPRDEAGSGFELIGSAIKDSAIFFIGAVLSSIETFRQYLEFQEVTSFYISVSILLGLIALILTKKPVSQKISITLWGGIIISFSSSMYYYFASINHLIEIHYDPNRFRETFFVYFIIGFIAFFVIGHVFDYIKDNFETRHWFDPKS